MSGGFAHLREVHHGAYKMKTPWLVSRVEPDDWLQGIGRSGEVLSNEEWFPCIMPLAC